MRDYFALPAVWSDELGHEVVAIYGAHTRVYPCLRVLAMGWSHSVFAAQTAHEHILDTRTTHCPPRDRITKLNDLQLSGERVLHCVYVDDVLFFSLVEAAANEALDEYLTVFDAVDLPAKRKKVVRPCATGVEGLGMVVNGTNLTVGVDVEKLSVLCAATCSLLKQSRATGLEVSRCVGRWTWAMLIARPALSVFNNVYRYINTAGAIPLTMWHSVRRELWTAVCLAPLLFASLSTTWFRAVVACDASLSGQGVCTAAVPVKHVVAAAAHCGILVGADEQKQAALNDAVLAAPTRWSEIVAKPWKRQDEHINHLELRSVNTAVRWVLSSPQSIGRRVLLLSDSQVAVGCLTKGRSSSHRLLCRMRPTCALLLASGIQLRMRWIASHLNPADEPSRRYST